MAFLHSHEKFGITFDQAYFRLHESEYRWKNEPEADQAGVAEKYTTVRGSFFVYKLTAKSAQQRLMKMKSKLQILIFLTETHYLKMQQDLLWPLKQVARHYFKGN